MQNQYANYTLQASKSSSSLCFKFPQLSAGNLAPLQGDCDSFDEDLDSRASLIMVQEEFKHSERGKQLLHMYLSRLDSHPISRHRDSLKHRKRESYLISERETNLSNYPASPESEQTHNDRLTYTKLNLYQVNIDRPPAVLFSSELLLPKKLSLGEFLCEFRFTNFIWVTLHQNWRFYERNH